MKTGYASIVVTPRAQPMPMALTVQSAALLSCDALALKQAVDELILSNPMVEPIAEDSAYSPIMQAEARRETLADYLLFQLRLTVTEPMVMGVCWYIVNSLDRNGYLRESDEEVCAQCRCDKKVFAQALHQVQKLDPVGVGARTLAECLTLQLQAEAPVNTLAVEIVREHLEALADHRLKLPGVDEDAVRLAVETIRSLNPRPGGAYDEEKQPCLIPDLLVERQGERIEVSLIGQPKLPSLCTQYAAAAQSGTQQERQYIRDHLAYARSFLYAVQQRSSVLLAVAALAAERQSGWLLREQGAVLQPLTLTAVAEELKISISTVSRAVKDKYVQYGDRIFPLKELFSAGGTENVSRQAILLRIEKICNAGGGKISDQGVADILEKEGVKIARRTVNKYRKNLSEGSASL